jgi:hypothetical protein
MALYYFSVENGVQYSAEDPEDLPDEAAARAVAEQTARELGRNNAAAATRRVVVRNANNEVVYEIPLKDGGS